MVRAGLLRLPTQPDHRIRRDGLRKTFNLYISALLATHFVLHQPDYCGASFPLLALHGHGLVHRTCPLSGVKRT